MAFIQTILADITLIFTFTLKNMDIQPHILAPQIFQIGLQPTVSHPLFAIGQGQVDQVIVIISPIKNHIVKIFNGRRFPQLFSGFSCTKACQHIFIAVTYKTVIQTPFDQRMNGRTPLICPEQFLNRLLFIQRTIRDQILKKQKH